MEISWSHTQRILSSRVIERRRKTKEAKAENVLDSLSKNRVYGESDDLAFKQLLRLNVEEYNRLQGGKGQIFDFQYGRTNPWNTSTLNQEFIILH